jgi:carbonic anhydrase
MRQSRVLLSALLVFAFALPLAAQVPPPLHEPFTVESLWGQLMEGNAEFMHGAIPYAELGKGRAANLTEQKPPVLILSCSDSRVPPELAFARGIGDLFVVRVAGNVADTFGIASIEYAVAHHWTKVIVVLGHERCGAVSEALKKKDPDTPSLLALVTRIRKSFAGKLTGKKRDDLREAIELNAKASADYIVSHSKLIGAAVHSGEVKVVVAYYNLGSGEVQRIRYEIPPAK